MSARNYQRVFAAAATGAMKPWTDADAEDARRADEAFANGATCYFGRVISAQDQSDRREAASRAGAFQAIADLFGGIADAEEVPA